MYFTRSCDIKSFYYKLSNDFTLFAKLFDTSGSEKLYKLYLDKMIQEADCILFVYDITNEESFNLFDSRYRSLIEEHKRSNISIVFCGNKADNEMERKVPFEKALEFCIENKFFFMETSCKIMKNVNNIFEALISLTFHSIIEKDKKNNDIIIKKIRNLIKKQYSWFSSLKKKMKLIY